MPVYVNPKLLGAVSLNLRKGCKASPVSILKKLIKRF